MTWSEWMQEECGYTTISTFWDDFTIAEKFGCNSIEETYSRAFNEWKDNYKMLTELVMVLNHKIWQFWEKDQTAIAECYNNLWEKADAYACNNLKGEALIYYYQITD